MDGSLQMSDKPAKNNAPASTIQTLPLKNHANSLSNRLELK